MKSDKKELIYECSYKNMRWKCRIKDNGIYSKWKRESLSCVSDRIR